jgi:phage head maturation protease
MSATIDTENNADAKALQSAINRKDVTGMSFAFLVGDEEWQGLDTDMPTRTIKSVAKVIEVSAVTYPAYEGTDIGARSDSLESDRAALERAKSAYINQDKSEDIELRKMKLKMKARKIQ